MQIGVSITAGIDICGGYTVGGDSGIPTNAILDEEQGAILDENGAYMLDET